jgi:hypothetical protein
MSSAINTNVESGLTCVAADIGPALIGRDQGIIQSLQIWRKHDPVAPGGALAPQAEVITIERRSLGAANPPE